LSHQGLGVALSQAGQLNMAIDHYRQAVKIRPNVARFESSLNQSWAASKG
jgi:Flp pilus assembly protein TadD